MFRNKNAIFLERLSFDMGHYNVVGSETAVQILTLPIFEKEAQIKRLEDT